MSVPSMVHRSGDTLVVRSVVTGDTIDGSLEDTEHSDELSDVPDDKLLPECKIRRNYSCSTCDYFSQNPRHFLYHLRDVHKEKVKIYECPNCLYASKHFQKLLRHTKMVHGTDGIEATEVKAKSKKRTLPEEDAENDDNSTEIQEADEENENNPTEKTLFKCSLCTFTARTQALLTKHEREEHIKTKFFRCTKCTYVTHMKARFTKHVKYHSMPMIKCDMCDFRTPYKWNLDRHCKNHNGKGAFRCSACNFTADIKQSLTVHEMNHHVPPVGQAAGLGVGRRRNKVGASDSTALEEAAQVVQTDLLSIPAVEDDVKKPAEKPKITAKKQKTANNTDQSGRAYGSDFIDPDDIIHHANGNIYIKNKCKLCNYKSAWDGEMAKHEKKVHNIVRNEPNKITKKPVRPVPNLIPIPTQSSVLKITARPGVSLLKAPEIETSSEPMMSQKDINDICAKSANSTLKDLASLFGSEDVFKNETMQNTSASCTPKSNSPEPELNLKIPDLIPAPKYMSTPKNDLKLGSAKFKHKNASFFDKLKDKLLTNVDTANLMCQYCGHESKCLTESLTHQKLCGKQNIQVPMLKSIYNLSSTRCKHCRQRCKSSLDLINHLQTCTVLKTIVENNQQYEDDKSSIVSEPFSTSLLEPEIKVEIKKEHEPHPMENKVFVWNDIVVPMDVDVEDQHDQNQYEYIDDKQDNVSLDLSIRTQSPCSESSFIGHETVQTSSVTDKIPTHGTDISIAQHKRVFKCPHCTFWASTASRFHVHIVGHLNKKPFECSLCAYRSNWRWDITKHIKLKSVRDPQHESAKVLMTDETGRRNYTKYNKYLTEIHVTGDHNETSGGSGTRPKLSFDSPPSQVYTSKIELPKLTRAPSSSDFSPLLRNTNLRPPPALKPADDSFFSKLASEKKRVNSDNKKTLWKCKKCNFRDASREKLLEHVKGHYPQSGVLNGNQFCAITSQSTETDEASVGGVTPRGQAPFRCGHCHQVSNWKHVIQRHCRLKHQGDIKVVIGSKNGPEKIEIDEQVDEPDHVDVPQDGSHKCKKCPFSSDISDELEQHIEGHTAKTDSVSKCFFCQFFVSQKEELYDHLKLHGINEPEEYVLRIQEKSGDGDSLKRYRCMICPYVTNSKSQFLYHKQFHKPRGGQYTCNHCSYNVSKRHLLHQHLKVHGINISLPQKPNGEIIDLDEISDEIEEVPSSNTYESQQFPDIPLVWVSKNDKFSKMFKCRYCPHVNSRKVNIQEHEKMHSVREKNPNTTRLNDVEHRCVECNYVCNNAGVLSSHSKVHQGLYGTIHCLVDPTKSDEEQIRELSRVISLQGNPIIDSGNVDEDFENVEAQENLDEPMQLDTQSDGLMYFCQNCPARFLKENEYAIHIKLHGSRLFYKCDYCSYTARQKPHILAHNTVHTKDYQDRSKILLNKYNTHPHHQPPDTSSFMNQNEEYIWVVEDGDLRVQDFEMEIESPPVVSKPQRSTMNIPLSGTELFQQKSEAQQKQAAEKFKPVEPVPPPQLHVDPQFGILMHGNPKFIYPTYLKNGKMKEKRYKCHKCPSAFEKREQYKVHLSLHGSKQKYKCESCDYSVKYYANYVQHMKKHQVNEEAQAARKSDEFNEEGEENEEIEDVPVKALKNINPKTGAHKMSVAEQQSVMIMQQRYQASTSSEIPPEDNKKLFWCPICPYTNHRKDAVDNHHKKHASVSGLTSSHTCEHCDYSVPQAHFLKDHVKLHFQQNKMHQLQGYMICDNLKLTAQNENNDNIQSHNVKNEIKEEPPENLVFHDRGEDTNECRFLPLQEQTLQRLNNNEGEKIFIHPETGEMVDKTKILLNSTEGSEIKLECPSISQISSDN